MDHEDKVEKMIQEEGLTAPRITPADIEGKIKRETFTILPSGKCIICEIVLENGFSVRGEASCVSKENFNEKIGKIISRKDAIEKICQLEAYLLQEDVYTGRVTSKDTNANSEHTFGWAMAMMKAGKSVARKSWNGCNMRCYAQFPDEDSKNTHPYIVIVIPGCDEGTRRLPWQPAQVDCFANDWDFSPEFDFFGRVTHGDSGGTTPGV